MLNTTMRFFTAHSFITAQHGLSIGGPQEMRSGTKYRKKITTKGNVCFYRNSKSWYRMAKPGFMYSREQCSVFLLKAALVQGLISTY